MKSKFKLTALACAALAAMVVTPSSVNAEADTCAVCNYDPGPPVIDQVPTVTLYSNTPFEVTVARPSHQVSIGSGESFQGIQTVYEEPTGWFADFTNRYLFGGGRDMGDWYCGSCSVVPTELSHAAEWGEFVTSVVNVKQWPNNGISPNGLNMGQWKPGDTVAICNGGGLCVVLTWKPGAGTVGWVPDLTKPTKIIKKDKGKYKNPEDAPGSPTSTAPGGVDGDRYATPVFDRNTGYVIFWMLTNLPPTITDITQDSKPACCVYPGLLETVQPGTALPGTPGVNDPGNFGGDGSGSFPGFDFGGGGGGGGGGGCVHVDSVLPDGRRAGDIRVGDSMQLGDEYTTNIDTTVGLVSYSQEKTVKGFRITTSNGTSLVCSETAPIWTDEGYVLAPNLLGKKVATRLDDQVIAINFRTVELVEPLGSIQVQHITVGDRAFWAGEKKGAYILHHNLKFVPE